MPMLIMHEDYVQIVVSHRGWIQLRWFETKRIGTAKSCLNGCVHDRILHRMCMLRNGQKQQQRLKAAGMT